MAAGKRRGETAPELGMLAENRVAIEGIDPCIEGDRFAAKAAEGRPLRVEADVFGDGHDLFAASVQIEGGVAVLMERLLNDRWSAEIGLDRIAPPCFAIHGWRDVWGTFARDTGKKLDAGQDVAIELQEAREILDASAAPRGQSAIVKSLQKAAQAVYRGAACPRHRRLHGHGRAARQPYPFRAAAGLGRPRRRCRLRMVRALSPLCGRARPS